MCDEEASIPGWFLTTKSCDIGCRNVGLSCLVEGILQVDTAEKAYLAYEFAGGDKDEKVEDGTGFTLA